MAKASLRGWGVVGKTRTGFSSFELVSSAIGFVCIVVLGTVHATLRAWVIVGIVLVVGSYLARRWLDRAANVTHGSEV
jgi:hypothetical protein